MGFKGQTTGQTGTGTPNPRNAHRSIHFISSLTTLKESEAEAHEMENQNMVKNISLTSSAESNQTTTVMPVSCTGFTCVPFIVIDVTLALAMMFGNGLMIASYVKFREIRCQSNFAIVSLACVDFITGSIGIPCHLVLAYLVFLVPSWQYLTMDKYFCLAKTGLVSGMVSLSFLHQFFIAVERYLKICHHFKCVAVLTNRRLVVALLCVWMYGIAINLPPLFGWNTWNPGVDCRANQVQGDLVRYVHVPHIPVCIVAALFLYFAIYYHVRQQKRKLSHFRDTNMKETTTDGPTEMPTQSMTLSAKIEVSRETVLSLPPVESQKSGPTTDGVKARGEKDTEMATPTPNGIWSTGSAARGRPNGGPASSQQRRDPQTKKIDVEVKVAKMTVVVVVTLIVLYLPFSVINLTEKYFSRVTFEVLYNVSLEIMFLSSISNPIIYGILNTRIRTAFLKLLKCGR
ncbi:D(3) dopamine receptor-like [Lingula anatina]|uniref:D(3) dopamine receptor-like n=1 Tax=Lingula anatina TaxID=7574 RepID=A0A1S3JZI2_LINAN|nr:D(3) dopamine receptor-like [Lingula anatina]|eukprot:XP_013415441.1 D(3) dopamine receptor-like [Lingula anatina]